MYNLKSLLTQLVCKMRLAYLQVVEDRNQDRDPQPEDWRAEDILSSWHSPCIPESGPGGAQAKVGVNRNLWA